MDLTVKILIIRFSSIGDIVLTTPVIRCLKEQLEGNVQIHYLTKKGYAELLVHNPYIEKLHTIEKSTNEIINELVHEEYDYIIDLHKNLRSRRVKRKLKGLYFTFDKLNWQKWLLVNFKINKLPNIHIVDRYLAATKALGVENDGKGLDFFINDRDSISAILPDHIRNYVAFVVGANHTTKKLTLEKAKEACMKIKRPIVLIGGKEDYEFGEKIAAINSTSIFNACGKTSLGQSALIIKNATIVIAPDTGMMHIAAAFQKRIVSIWGNTIPEFGMYPYLRNENKGNSTILEVNDLNCRPCSKIGFDKCPKGHFNCINKLAAEEIASYANNT